MLVFLFTIQIIYRKKEVKMSLNNKTYQPVQVLTIKATADIPAKRFVNFAGKTCGANQKSFGVSLSNYNNGSYVSVVVLGTAIVEAGGTITTGDNLTSDSLGRAIVASAGTEINGRALNSAETGEFVRVLLVP